MGSSTTVSLLRGLVFSAPELRVMHPEWPGVMIEDYLALYDNLAVIADVVDQKEDRLKSVINVSTTDSPFTVNDIDQEYVFDTTVGDIIASLNAGVDGRRYRMTNVGAAGNKVIITPDGAEQLFGSATENIYDAETLDMTFETLKGWW